MGIERYLIEETDASLIFVFSNRKRWWIIIHNSIGTVFVLAFSYTLSTALFLGNIDFSLQDFLNPITYLNLTLVIFLGVPIILWPIELLWQLVGKEYVEISASGIILHHQIFRHEETA